MRVAVILAAIALAGCRGSFEIGRARQEIITPLAAGVTIIDNNDEEVIEPAAPPARDCQARARFFRGTVAIPCADIGRATAP
jgi:hypothetical protein